ncbi:hypothetical protein ACJRO7_032687 [Eucalyptus globulus]|uniref:F-box domain-containing protein n=1 Tax=Eucalyptus globulus TaxID=34317 RepID=A0ABD3JWY1_EUCGL
MICSCSLPEEIVVLEIMKRLPVKSLLRFRCVSRMWYTIINHPCFVALHLKHSDAANWYLVCLDRFDPVQSLCCSLFSNGSLTVPSKCRIEIPLVAPPNCYGFMGSCNGLIWITEISQSGHSQTMYLWNLFTRKYRPVRPRRPLHRPAHVVSGFGFDARSHDYKIVRILHFPDVHGRCFGVIKPQVEIYSLHTDSWRTLKCRVPTFCNHKPAIFLNGNMHWYVSRIGDPREEGGHGAIVTFNVASEVFKEMAPPKEFLHKAKELLHEAVILGVSVAVLNDSLAVLINRRDVVLHPELHPELHSICSVWVMSDYGVPESWTKLYTFEACGLVMGFHGFMRNGELFMDIDGGGRVSWNPITRQFANLPLSTTCDMVTVMKSIVSV